MWAAMILVIFLYTTAYTKEATECNTLTTTTLNWSQFNNCEHVLLSNKSINRIETSKESYYGKLTKLDISYNDLTGLPNDFLSTASALKEVHLQYNGLKHLPERFLSSSSRLESVSLEGNPLSEIPPSIFQETLVNLTLDCRCDLVSNLMNANYSERVSALCKKSGVLHKVKDFYKEDCGNQYLALYIALPTLMIVLIVGGVALYLWKRKRSSTSLESKGAADKSPAHGQPRYMSRNIESTETTLSPGHRQDYENVFVGHSETTETKSRGYLENDHRPGTHRSKHMAEEDIYLESDINEGDQPIYTNTQGVYYNYSEPSHMKSRNHDEDDVYILPDH